MIKLLEITDFEVKKDFEHKYGMIVLKNDIIQFLREKLQLSASKRELIYTNDLRGIGKTCQLIKFAEIQHYAVVVNSIMVAKSLKEQYKFDEIYSWQQAINKEISNKKIVIDECVDFQKIKDDEYYEIITGFSNKYIDNENVKTTVSKIECKEFNFNKSVKKDVIENLEEEIKSLNKIIVKTRQNREYGTYKNLIISLKEVLELYNSEINKDKNNFNPIINIHMNSNIKDGQEIIKALNDLPSYIIQNKN